LVGLVGYLTNGALWFVEVRAGHNTQEGFGPLCCAISGVKMLIKKIKPYEPSFGYSSPLKTIWKKGGLPTVKKGFYGDTLTKKNVSLEHLKARSKGGKTSLENLVLASKEKNNLRGNADIKNFVDRESVLNYLIQFMGIKTKNFNGDNYISAIIKTLSELGVNL